MRDSGMKLSVVGLGKLGSPMLAVLAASGFEVIGVDTNPAVVTAINEGRAPVQEPGLQTLLDMHRPFYSATPEMTYAVQNSDATFVIVPTPSGSDGCFTLGYLRAACEQIGAALAQKDAYHLIVIVCTVMPGQMRDLNAVLEQASGKRQGVGFGLCYSPEFIALGNVIHDLQHPDYILIGAEDQHAGDLLSSIYRQVTDTDVITRVTWIDAEIAKIAQNTFLTMKIVFANQLGQLCQTIPGANVDHVTQALMHDRRIGPHFLKAGTAYGGTCFPRDNRAFARLAEKHGVNFYSASVMDHLNIDTTIRLASLVFQHSGGTKTVGILGLSFKPGTSVLEESASMYLIDWLFKMNQPSIIVFDPLAMDEARTLWKDRVSYAVDAQSCIQQAEVIVLMHSDRGLMGSNGLNGKTLIDPWRVSVRQFRENGFHDVHYIPLGIGPQEE